MADVIRCSRRQWLTSAVAHVVSGWRHPWQTSSVADVVSGSRHQLLTSAAADVIRGRRHQLLTLSAANVISYLCRQGMTSPGGYNGGAQCGRVSASGVAAYCVARRSSSGNRDSRIVTASRSTRWAGAGQRRRRGWGRPFPGAGRRLPPRRSASPTAGKAATNKERCLSWPSPRQVSSGSPLGGQQVAIFTRDTEMVN